MKNKIIILFVMILCLSACFVFLRCTIPFGFTAYPPKMIRIFKFVNDDYKNKILILLSEDIVDYPFKEKFFIPLNEGSERFIPVYPRIKKDRLPFSYSDEDEFLSDIYEQYDICELSNNLPFIELHDGWCMFYPYRWDIYGWPNLAIDAEWEDICNPNINLDSVEILGWSYSVPYYSIWVSTISKLQKKKMEKLTIEDVIQCLNKIIDEGKLDKYGSTIGPIVDELDKNEFAH